jgi:hypothetical protein
VHGRADEDLVPGVLGVGERERLVHDIDNWILDRVIGNAR